MGSMKDINDLLTDLIKSVKDRETAAKIAEIQALVLSFQTNHIETVEENLRLRGEIASMKKQLLNSIRARSELKMEMEELKAENRALKHEMSEIPSLTTETQKELFPLAMEPGNKFSYNNKMRFPQDESGQFYCPLCLVNRGVESPLVEAKTGWGCPACDDFFPDPDRQLNVD